MTNKSIHISLDLETLSTESTAAIVQIGAVVIGSPDLTFDMCICPRRAERAGMTVSTETLHWWGKQPSIVRKRVMSGTASPLEALHEFTAWCTGVCEGDLDRAYLWTNGADFDLPILRNAYELFMTYPFNHRNHRCFRTLLAYTGVPRIPSTSVHDALEDAKAQAATLATLALA
jgi:DNA polymerase III epsilon subunit-like protein